MDLRKRQSGWRVGNCALVIGTCLAAAALSGCGGGAKDAGAASPRDASVRSADQRPGASEAAPIPDYATKLAEWVEAHQPHKSSDNHWPDFVDVTAQIRGAWEFFLAADPELSAHVAANPDANWLVARPRLIIRDPQLSRFKASLRVFFDRLAATGLLERLDDLTSPARFVALRATEPLTGSPGPEFGATRIVAELCEARVRLMLEGGTSDQAARSLAHALAIFRAAQGRGILMGYLLASTQIAVVEEIGFNVMEGRVDAAAAQAMLDVLTHASPPDLRVAIGGERIVTLDIIDRYFEKARMEAIARAGHQQTESAGEAVVTASRDEQVSIANRHFDACALMLSADADERARGQAENRAIDEMIEKQRETRSYLPVSACLVSIARMEKRSRIDRAEHDGVRTMLALEVYKGRTGHYPEILEQLVPGELDAIPVDPFGSGSAFRYRRVLSVGGTAQTGYLLYSVGADGEDNGGKQHAKLPGTAFSGPRVAQGYDFVFNSKLWGEQSPSGNP